MQMQARGVELLAPAKVNLTLEVLGRRDDGYHELRTVFQAIALYDRIVLEPADSISLIVDGEAPEGEDNLVMRVARELANTHPGRGALIRLEKRIPEGAGLAGGSSDAVAALRGLNALWQLGLSTEELRALAAGLGADVPFFLYGGIALGSGRGDSIEPLERSAPTFPVLATPPFPLPGKTARIFAELRPEEYTDGSRTAELWRGLQANLYPRQEHLFNGLLGSAYRVFGELREYHALLERRTGTEWTLSGAGPTFYCLAPSEDEAKRIGSAARTLPGRHFVTKSAGPII